MIINAAKRQMYIEDVLYYYRTNEASTTHKYNPYYFDSLKKTNTLCIEYSKEWGNHLEHLAHRRASRACVLSIKNVLSSDLGLKDSYKEINSIISIKVS